jgi:hypothetical protein
VVVVVTVDVDVVVVVVVVVDSGGVVTGDDGAMAVVVVISGLFGARITNFNNRERVTATIARTIKDMQMILNQRWCHHLLGPVILLTNSL